ncbi:hypothetical protein, partial [Pandoraea nosoerga]|uniref:hypothetical protein n=1 Tax=Pandoraea nosoerga TaxID=2508296 RepID=UPI001C2DD5CF
MRIPIACGWRRMPGFLLFWSTDSHEDIERTRLPGAHLPMRIGCGGNAPAASLQYGAMWRNVAQCGATPRLPNAYSALVSSGTT